MRPRVRPRVRLRVRARVRACAHTRACVHVSKRVYQRVSSCSAGRAWRAHTNTHARAHVRTRYFVTELDINGVVPALLYFGACICLLVYAHVWVHVSVHVGVHAHAWTLMNIMAIQ